MCNQCPTVTQDRICTHKDYDRACGCVECLFCRITMIQCNPHQDDPERTVHSIISESR